MNVRTCWPYSSRVEAKARLTIGLIYANSDLSFAVREKYVVSSSILLMNQWHFITV